MIAAPDLQPPAPGPNQESERSGLSSRLRLWAFLLIAPLVAALGIATGLARFGGAYVKHPLETVPPSIEKIPTDLASAVERLERKVTRVVREDEIYITVDTYQNRLRIFRGRELLREAICSTGSGVRLRDPRNGREWIFDSPQGELKITRKVKNPVWVKPDWAFIEEGFEPPKSMRDRVDDVSLGKYGLYLRDGYIIHGTIFQSLLGKRVTHGCVRLGDKDLEFAYQIVPVGTRVFLY